MDEKINATPPVPPVSAIPAVPAVPTKVYEVDGKDRVLLPLAWLLGVLFAELGFVWFWGWGLLVPVLVAVWYGVLFWYCGMEGFASRPSLLLFGAVFLLALSYAVFANPWFRMWNGVALPLLVGLQMFQWTGAGRYEWYLPRMLTQRLGLLFGGLFTHVGAFFQALTSFKGHAQKRVVYVLMGLGVTIPLLFLVIPLLGTADALFLHLTAGMVEWVSRNLFGWAGRLMLGLFFALLLFSLLYSVRRPEAKKEKAVSTARTVDAVLPITVLLAMDVLYLVFVGVQFAALFGGEPYLTAAGISYADYARSGFFQLVFVAGLNLTLGLLAVQFCVREGSGWRLVRVLATLLVGASVIMLGSAAYRMTIYVMEYGLSFKRFLTYWGMVMLAIFFIAALLKIWRKNFGFFRVLLAAGLAGWLLLNYCNVDWLVSRYNEGRYGQDASAFDRADLTYQAADWRSWSVSAQMAALDKK